MRIARLLPFDRCAPLFLLVLASAALTMTSCRVQGIADQVFQCERAADCGEGFVCLAGYCRADEDVESGIYDRCGGQCGAERKTCCDGECVDLRSDRDNCGGCATRCAANEVCHESLCMTESSFGGSCANGLDDDGDGRIDCADVADCKQGTACRNGVCCDGACRNEGVDGSCSNGLDDDCDGLVDCEDTDCSGRVCGDARICRSGECITGCFLDARFVEAGEAHPQHPCLVCRPEADVHEWSPAERLGACGEGGQCDGDGVCRGAIGAPCAGPGDCATHDCVEGVCAQ